MEGVLGGWRERWKGRAGVAGLGFWGLLRVVLRVRNSKQFVSTCFATCSGVLEWDLS